MALSGTYVQQLFGFNGGERRLWYILHAQDTKVTHSRVRKDHFTYYIHDPTLTHPTYNKLPIMLSGALYFRSAELGKTPWRVKLFYYTQLDILLKSVNCLLDNVLALGISALFITAVGYSAIMFALLAQYESLFACCYLATVSVAVTLVGFSVYKYSEIVEGLSADLVKEVQEQASEQIREHVALRHITHTGSGGHRSSYFGRNFRRLPLRLDMKPLGRVEKGSSVAWMEQIVETTASAIFMVTLGNTRIAF